MSHNMPGNPYATHSYVADDLPETDVDWAIVQATMALAYEQRTANLTALYAAQIRVNRPVPRGLHDLVFERLGLEPDQ